MIYGNTTHLQIIGQVELHMVERQEKVLLHLQLMAALMLVQEKGILGRKLAYIINKRNILGIEELEDKLSVYPNPATNKIHLTSKSTTIETIELISSTGEKVLQEAFTPVLDIDRLPSGVYFLTGFDKEKNSTAPQKLIIQ